MADAEPQKWGKPTNSLRDKLERYIAQDGHNPDLRRKAYSTVAAKMGRTIHAVIKSGEPYRPLLSGGITQRQARYRSPSVAPRKVSERD